MNELLGRRIKELRSAKNFTQEQMATQIGVSRQKYARLESGINSITLDLLSKIAKTPAKLPRFSRFYRQRC